MRLTNLLQDIKYQFISGERNLEISSVAYDSREVKEGSLFICIKGYASDGHAYIEKAIEAGASAILVEDIPVDFAHENVTLIQVPDTREALAYISAAWFDYPANQLTVIGLTGTKGKTTTAHMIKKILEESGKKVGMIGTIGAYIGDEKIPTKNTTPESYELHSLFRKMLEKECSHVVMEVSSQGLKLKRTAGITFDYGAFLNLSPDHISPNEHKDFDEYKACKKLLFAQTDYAIVNKDADFWQEMIEGCDNVITTSCRETADYMAIDIQNKWKPGFLGVSFEISGKLSANLSLNMPGVYNTENALVATAICDLIGVNQEYIDLGLKKVSVKGRTQVVQEVAHFTTFIIDYAHNAISTESVLSTLKSYNPDRLICIFGGGGNKPKQRRFDMGQMAGRYADLSIITMDNPRYESMADINVDIIRGIDSEHGQYMVIDDRKEAIEYMIDHAQKGDIVALIGKGHEEYQEVCGKKYYFSEIEVIRNYVKTK